MQMRPQCIRRCKTPPSSKKFVRDSTLCVEMRYGVVNGQDIQLCALIALTTAGCLQVQPQPPVPPTTMSSWGPLGGFTMTSGSNCAGYATLSNRESSVSASCFTGSDNIVMCTDATAANPATAI